MSDSIGTSSDFLMAHEPKFPKQAIVAFFLRGIALFCATAMAELSGAWTLKMSRTDTPGVRVLCQRSRDLFMPGRAPIQAPRGVSRSNSSPTRSLRRRCDYMRLMDPSEKTGKLIH